MANRTEVDVARLPPREDLGVTVAAREDVESSKKRCYKGEERTEN
jgi:hypothetical protein